MHLENGEANCYPHVTFGYSRLILYHREYMCVCVCTGFRAAAAAAAAEIVMVVRFLAFVCYNCLSALKFLVLV